jgi:hypothetical protein
MKGGLIVEMRNCLAKRTSNVAGGPCYGLEGQKDQIQSYNLLTRQITVRSSPAVTCRMAPGSAYLLRQNYI